MRGGALESVCRRFPAIGEVLSVRPVPGGHIHESWHVSAQGGEFFVQRCNTTVFTDLDAVMVNVVLVCEAMYPDLCPLTRRDGTRLWRNAGETWRAFPFMVDTVNACDVPDLRLSEVGRGLGRFHRGLAKLDPAGLLEPIPNFHDPRRRLGQLDSARMADVAGRAAGTGAELEAVDGLRDLAELADEITPPRVPRRVAHFDAKLDNFLLDGSGRVRAVIDLDTVMPGSILWDVGDLVRSATATAEEDEPIPDRMQFVPERYRDLLDGYLSEATAILTPSEREGLAVAPLVITFEQAVRFLTDYLGGDRYYRTSRPDHNLERARAQLALVESMRAQRSAMILAP